MKQQTVPRQKHPRGFLSFVAAIPLLAGGFDLWKCELAPSTLVVDPLVTNTSNGNGLLEPGETATIEPFWNHRKSCVLDGERYHKCSPFTPPPLDCSSVLIERGTVTAPMGHTSARYVFSDRVAQYTLPDHSPRSCSQDQDCYSLDLPVQTRPPDHHLDATFMETLTGTRSATTTWIVHVGESFADVPQTHLFYKPIETLFHNGITSGCTGQDFCPSSAVTRSDAAILISKALTRGTNIPTSGSVSGELYNCSAGGASVFDDVAPTDPLCRHAHSLASRSIMKACRPRAFCPAQTISRVLMAVHIARAMVAGNDDHIPWSGCDPHSAYQYAYFTDVPVSNDFCKFVNFLASRGVVAGCRPHQFCPAGIVTRDQMAKFLVKALALNLNGP